MSFLWRVLTVEKGFARIDVKSSLIYILGCSLVKLYSLSCLPVDITRNRSFLDRKRTIIGIGSSSLACRGFLNLWLTSMSLSWKGGSTLRTSLASAAAAGVVFSTSSALRTGSGMPEIRALFRRAYCSRSS